MAKAKTFSLGKTIFLSVLALIVGFVLGAGIYFYITFPKDRGDIYVSGDLQIHFLELGNNYTGDCVYINAGGTDILVDAGSRKASAATIKAYLDEYVTDGKLEYVIATHSDQDHISGFVGSSDVPGIFESYEIDMLIDFTQVVNETQLYGDYLEERQALVDGGTTHYTALECYNNEGGAQRAFELSDGIVMNILYNYYYDHTSSDNNNYSVCFQIEQGDKKFLFTGDLEEEGEERLVEYNELSQVELFKAGHHGSKTSSNDILLDIIQPKMVVVCCCAGSVEYLQSGTQNLHNSFPTQDFINRVSKHTELVYVTTRGEIVYDEEKGRYVDNGYGSMNGNVVVTSNKNGVTVECSNNNTILKDTDWFKSNRDMPSAWAS